MFNFSGWSLSRRSSNENKIFILSGLSLSRWANSEKLKQGLKQQPTGTVSHFHKSAFQTFFRPENSDPENSDPENSDLENSDLENSDPEKSDPSRFKKKI